MTISINCKILKLLLNDHILDCRSDSASSSQRELTAGSKHHWCGSHLFMEVRHAGNKAPGQLSEYTEINVGIPRKEKKKHSFLKLRSFNAYT